MMRDVPVTEAIDSFLAEFLRCGWRGETRPAWPADWVTSPNIDDAVMDRISFHGLAFVCIQDTGKLADWPVQVRNQVQAEARSQSFWELGHKGVLARLVAALSAAGIAGTVIKGTALAYSVYPDPAARRRGDSDLLLGETSRAALRKILTACNFQPIGDARPLQESWATQCEMGFTHVFDLHWRINASPVVAQCLEQGGVGTRTTPLPRLSGASRGVAPTDNLILGAINRASHKSFGYRSGDALVFDQNRLIWALDYHLLCASFSQQDWQDLLATAAASGTAPIVLSALTFAEATLHTVVPADIKADLARQHGDARLLKSLSALQGPDRLWLDLSASPGMLAKLRLVRYSLFPGTEVLHERFPDLVHWPVPALQIRRLVAGLGKLRRKRA